MLQSLYINNYAIINELGIDFPAGMIGITGETGAGKSIIIGALNLILGERADTSVLVHKEKKCIIEGVFMAEEKETVKLFLLNNDIDQLADITIRREIAVNGKSRAFINDTPVNLTQLQDLGSLLVDLHQQFDSISVGNTDFQIDVLDDLASNQRAVLDYQKCYNQWQHSAKELENLNRRQEQFAKESDYNNFQYKELAEAGFNENELEDIDSELKLLSHAESIKAALGKAYSQLDESNEPIVQQLKSIINLLNNFSDYQQQLPQLIERLHGTQVELQDIAAELESINNHIHYDAEKIERLNERLSLGYKLQKKHGVQSTNALLEIQQQLEEKLQAVLLIANDIEKLEKQTHQLHQQTTLLAEKISQARKSQINPFEKKVNQLLNQVGMPNASIKVSIIAKPPGPTGMDAIEFLFDANKSGQFKPVNKVASGGELSRLMLCIKSLVAKSLDMPTLIFDEIDSGISGEAAKQVGIIMKELATNRQVICITHQPQIAGKTSAHFFVYKELSGNMVNTNIRLLTYDERIIAIAKMLGGEKPTAAAIENAKELLQQ